MRLASLALLALSLPACDSAADAEPTFGDPYRIVTDPAPALVASRVASDDEAPGDLLTVAVEYTGGCEEHAFVLRSRDLGDRVEVWFVHDGRGDLCEQAVTETLTATLPGVAVEAETLVLQAPLSAPISLR